MDIEGLGEERIRLLIEQGLICDPSDLYRLEESQLVSLPKMGTKSAEALVAAIAASRDQPLARVLIGLGIRHVGPTAARALADRFGTIDAVLAAPVETLAAIDGVGDVIASSLRAFAEDAEQRALVERLQSAGLTMHAAVPDAPEHDDLAAYIFVLTGTLDAMTRDEASRALRARGASIASSVSKKTSAVFAGEHAGSKLAKAESLGIPVFDEETLARVIELGAAALPAGN